MDLSGAILRVSVHLVSEGNQYSKTLTTAFDGQLVAEHLPYGLYRFEISQPGFEYISTPIQILSSIPVRKEVRLKLASVNNRFESNPLTHSSTLISLAQSLRLVRMKFRPVQNHILA